MDSEIVWYSGRPHLLANRCILRWKFALPDFHTVLTDASQLPVDDRLKLIEALASSVPDAPPPALSHEGLTEVQRRSEEIDSGTVTTETWSNIRSRLFAKYGIRDAD